MFAGTTLVTAKQGEQASSNTHVPDTPDGGCLCYVLRSGFLSAQGELMMMIEFSQEKVSAGHTHTHTSYTPHTHIPFSHSPPLPPTSSL